MRIYENIYIRVFQSFWRLPEALERLGTVLSCTSTSYRRVAKHFPKSWRSTEIAVAIVYSYNPMHSTPCTSRDRFMSLISVLNLAVFLNSVFVLWCQYDVVRRWNSLDFFSRQRRCTPKWYTRVFRFRVRLINWGPAYCRKRRYSAWTSPTQVLGVCEFYLKHSMPPLPSNHHDYPPVTKFLDLVSSADRVDGCWERNFRVVYYLTV